MFIVLISSSELSKEEVTYSKSFTCSNRNTRKMFETLLKLTIKTPEANNVVLVST